MTTEMITTEQAAAILGISPGAWNERKRYAKKVGNPFPESHLNRPGGTNYYRRDAVEAYAVGETDVVPALPILEFVQAQRAVTTDPVVAERLNQVSMLLKNNVKVGYYEADAICCDLLHRHPADVYGPEWFEFGDSVDLQVEEGVA